jgi:hypothetical protein
MIGYARIPASRQAGTHRPASVHGRCKYGVTMGEERILVSTAYEKAVKALAPKARPGDEYFERLIKDSKEPEISIDFEEIDRLESRVHRPFVDALTGLTLLVWRYFNGGWSEAGDPEYWRTAGFGVPGALSLTDESSTWGPDGKLDSYIIQADFEKWLASETEKPVETHTGLPGRPSAKHLINAEFERIVEEKRVPATVRDTAEVLAEWFSETHPKLAQPTVGTIENNIRDAHRSTKPTK